MGYIRSAVVNSLQHNGQLLLDKEDMDDDEASSCVLVVVRSVMVCNCLLSRFCELEVVVTTGR